MITDKSLEVYYQDGHVGTLAIMPDKRVAFEYTDDWIRNGFSISPFSLPLRKEVFIPKESSREYFKGLFGVFADSLPDAWGELLLMRHLSSLGIDAGSITALDRLAYVGSSGMGALEYRPSKNSDFNINILGLDYDFVAGECSKVLSSIPSDEMDELYFLGGSSGGTRPKILLRDNEKEFIVKFPAGEDPSICGKREYDYSICAKKCGIIMTRSELIPSKRCEGYFKTERFDRFDGKKILAVTVAGLLELDYRAPSCDYESLLKLTNILTKGNTHDLEQMYLIMCFNVLTHNLDDHVKNFSFLYTANAGWRLAPAYDLTYSNTYFGEHTTSVSGKGRDISDEDMITVGTKAGLSKAKCVKLLDKVRNEVKALDIYTWSTGE